ncbi:hypothetical protein [Bradyrhizobium manausense]|uniref:hypothetical protein n=1 Tax=Bradyrhizobium manausense TaxID=989370 RepID=UPI00138EDAF7|nr:hypothetical protein [Bradyrhizobium manausense]
MSRKHLVQPRQIHCSRRQFYATRISEGGAVAPYDPWRLPCGQEHVEGYVDLFFHGILPS